MGQSSFRTSTGRNVTAATATEMRAVDRVAVEEVGLGLLQMMENAGRALAWHVRDVRDEGDSVLVVAGNGGNGGGGMACARHLANRGVPVRIVVDRSPADLSGAAATQHRVLDEMDVSMTTGAERISRSGGQRVVVDALVGYGLDGEVRPPASGLIERLNRLAEPIVSLTSRPEPTRRRAKRSGSRSPRTEPSHSHSRRPGSTRSRGRSIQRRLFPGSGYDRQRWTRT